jgi:SAM-dependent methyltransferase
MEQTNYIIRGGIEGTERLRLLSRVMRATTSGLLDRVGIRPGMECLEVGCGSGDVAFDLARRVGPQGRVVATDIDQIKLELASREAGVQRLSNIEFRLSDIMQDNHTQEFDLVHARFILTHLPNPEGALTKMRQALRPGGVVVIEEIDFRGHFCHPDSPALWRYIDLYTQAVQLRGGDANIGPLIPALLEGAGFETIHMNVVQPAGTTGEIKLISAITMENIAGAVVAEGLATQDEIDQIVAELYEYAGTFGTLSSAPRIVEAWGYQSLSEGMRSV